MNRLDCEQQRTAYGPDRFRESADRELAEALSKVKMAGAWLRRLASGSQAELRQAAIDKIAMQINDLMESLPEREKSE